MDKHRVLEIIRKSPKFPSPPSFVRHLCQISFMQNVKAEEILPLLKYHRDQLIKICRSDFYNVPKEVKKLKELIPAVGSANLRNLVFLVWMLQFKSPGKYDPHNYEELKQHWFLCGAFAQNLGDHLGLSHREDLYLQAILQDIGLLALARTTPEIYRKLESLFPGKTPLLVAEEEEIGVNHAQLGAEILSEWEFPDNFTGPIALHHAIENDPKLESPHKSAAQVIRFADDLARTLLREKDAPPYSKLENLYTRFFERPSNELPYLIRNTLCKLRGFAENLGLSELKNLSGLRLLKENKDFLERRLIPYEELLDELISTYGKMDHLEMLLEQNETDQMASYFRDGVTGLYNHAYFQETLCKEIAKSIRYEHPVSIIIFDIDGFDLFNQAYGFASGSAILQQIGELLQKGLREADIICRYGADEFAIILPHTGKVQATTAAEKMRKVIRGTAFEDPFRDLRHTLTISLGYTTLEPRIEVVRKEELLDRALEALKQSRKSGGDSCVYR